MDKIFLHIDIQQVEKVINDLHAKAQSKTKSNILEILSRKKQKQHDKCEIIMQDNYPTLTEYGILLEDTRVHKKLMKEMYYLKKNLCTTTILSFSLENNAKKYFV